MSLKLHNAGAAINKTMASRTRLTAVYLWQDIKGYHHILKAFLCDAFIVWEWNVSSTVFVFPQTATTCCPAGETVTQSRRPLSWLNQTLQLKRWLDGRSIYMNMDMQQQGMVLCKRFEECIFISGNNMRMLLTEGGEGCGLQLRPPSLDSGQISNNANRHGDVHIWTRTQRRGWETHMYYDAPMQRNHLNACTSEKHPPGRGSFLFTPVTTLQILSVLWYFKFVNITTKRYNVKFR